MAKPPKAKPPTFDELLAYLYWVRVLTHPGADDSDEAVAARAELSVATLQKWKARQDVPSVTSTAKGLAAALGVSWEWLTMEGGEAPLPMLFNDWLAARRGTPLTATDRRYQVIEVPGVTPAAMGLIVAGTGAKPGKKRPPGSA